MDRKKQFTLTILITIVLIFVIFISLIILFIPKNPYNGEQAEISNLNTLTKGKAQDSETVNFIKHELWKILNKNNQNIQPEKIKDITIRKESFSQKYNQNRQRNEVDFIVDIKSLKQSYKVSYQWAIDPKNLDEYGIIISCLPSKDLIYGNFACKDFFTDLSGEQQYISRFIPYNDVDFKLEGIDLNAKKPVIKALILIFRWELDTEDYSARETEIKQSIYRWFQNHRLDINNYEIIFETEIN